MLRLRHTSEPRRKAIQPLAAINSPADRLTVWRSRRRTINRRRTSRRRRAARRRVYPRRDVPAPAEPIGRDQFAGASENPFKVVREAPVSTFSIDVDTASYSFVRASLNRNVLPQPAAVRTEEMINYFPYDYDGAATRDRAVQDHGRGLPEPVVGGPQARPDRHQGLCGPTARARPRANLVFLIDTSGSMNAPNRLPLVKQSLAMLLDQLQPTRPRRDRHLCGQRRHRARADRGQPRRARSSAVIERLRRGRQHRGRRGHPPGLCARRAELRSERRQPRHPGDRRRLQRRDHQPGRAEGLRRARARQGRVPVGARLRHGQLQRRADADAGAERQRRRGLHRHRRRGAQDAGRGGDLDAVPDRQGREDPGRVQPGHRRRISADRLRDPAAQPRGLRQ